MANNAAGRMLESKGPTHLSDFSQLDPLLPEQLAALQPRQRSLLQTKLHGIPAELRVSVAEIRIGNQTERLYALENLSGELTARESSAWRNLIRVLTHEIMNTLTPVTSLAETSVSMLEQTDANEDLVQAITTIARRSEGLLHFVGSYRELLKVPEPVFSDVQVADLIDTVVNLMRNQLERIDVVVRITPRSLTINGDPDLLDQVLVNIVKNAIDAVAEQPAPRIELLANLDRAHTIVSAIDNGCGIPSATLEQVFVPFYTTKRDGSGIGLSLSRQIMNAHGGDLSVESVEGEGTTVRMIL